MRILYVHPKGELAGGDISLLTMLKNINKKKFTPFVIVAKKGPLYSEYKKYSKIVNQIDFTVMKYPDNFFELINMIIGVFPSIVKIWFIIKKWKIDLVHVNSIVIPSAIIAAKLAGKPVIVHKREIIVSTELASKFLDLVAYLFANKVITVSKEVKNSSLKILQNKTVVIYNGVDISKIPVYRKNKIRNLYKIPKSTMLVGVFSRIEPWKGQHIVIKALPNVIKKFKDVKAVIFGTYYTKRGEAYFKELKNLVEKLNLEDKVIFPGLVKDINNIYNEFDLVILPSIKPEPLGRVTIEAMASSRVVIATDIGGSKECIINNKTGLLIKENDVKAMETAIEKLLGNTNLREQFGLLGRRRAENIFNIKKIIVEIENIYETLVKH